MDPKYDTLDNLFRKHLSDETPDNQWNVPEDNIFQKAIAQVDISRRKNYKVFTWLFLMMGVLMFLIVHEYRSVIKFRDLKQYTTRLEKIIQNEKKPIANKSAQTAAEPFLIDMKEGSSSSLRHIMQEVPSGVQKKESILDSKDAVGYGITKKGYETSSQTTRQDMVSGTNAEDVLEPSPRLNNASHVEENSTKQKLKISFTERLPMLPNSIVIPQREISEISVLPKTTISPTEKSNTTPWTIALLYGGNASWLTMRNVPFAMESKLTKYTNAQLSTGIHSWIQKKLSNRWSAAMGLGYQSYRNESELVNTMYYDEEKEIITSTGDPVYQTDVDMSNPLGEHRSITNVPLGQAMHQNDVILENLYIRQAFTVASFELGLDYTLWRTENIVLALGSGINYNVKVSMENDFDVNLFADGFEHHYQENVRAIGGFNDTFVAAHIRFMTAIKLDNHWSILAETRYGQSITSLRDSWPASGPQTYLHSLNVSLGLSYHF